MAPSGRRLVWACAASRSARPSSRRALRRRRGTPCTPTRPFLDSTLALANAEPVDGGIVGFLPLIAIPGVLVGIPFLVFNRLKDLEGDAYTETVFTDKQPPRRPGAEPVVRKKDIDMSYAELEQKYGEATLFKEDPPPSSAAPADAPFALPELPNPLRGGAAPPPKYEAPPSQPEEEFALPELKLPSLPSFPSFGGGDASPPKYDDAAPAPPEASSSSPSFPCRRSRTRSAVARRLRGSRLRRRGGGRARGRGAVQAARGKFPWQQVVFPGAPTASGPTFGGKCCGPRKELASRGFELLCLRRQS